MNTDELINILREFKTTFSLKDVELYYSLHSKCSIEGYGQGYAKRLSIPFNNFEDLRQTYLNYAKQNIMSEIKNTMISNGISISDLNSFLENNKWI